MTNIKYEIIDEIEAIEQWIRDAIFNKERLAERRCANVIHNSGRESGVVFPMRRKA